MEPPAPAQPARYNKKLVLIAVLVFLIAISGLVLFLNYLGRKNAPVPSPNLAVSKTWELRLSFNNRTGTLSFSKLRLLDQTIRPDPRVAEDSLYTLYLLDGKSAILSKQKINITEQLLVDYLPGATPSAELPAELQSIVYIPYVPAATGMRIVNNNSNTLLLDIKIPPQKTSFVIPDSPALSLSNVIRTAHAQTSGHPLQIVFISDGFTDMNQFHQLVSQIEAKYNSTEPYASANPSIFDFKILDNTQPLGCTQGLFSCLNSSNLSNISQIGYNHYPNAGKFIVLVNNPNAARTDGGTLGATSGIGGNIAIVVNRPDFSTATILDDATHELLGHAIGELYDRYVSTDPSYDFLQANMKSNCTDNSNGEAFWRDAGITSGASRGCMNQTRYAPVAPTCPGGGPYISGGTPNSVMSLVGCATSSGFDPVEQWWIKNHIIPRYQQAAAASPTPTPVSSVTGSFPSPTSGPSSGASGGAVGVTTDTPTEITSTSMMLNATVTSIPGGTIRIRNFQYYDTVNDPSVCNSFNSQGQPVFNSNCLYTEDTPGQWGTGSFSKPITGLTPGHTYAIRAYAVNDNNLPGYAVSQTGWGGWGRWITQSTVFSGFNNSGVGTGNTSPEAGTGGAPATGVYTCREVPLSTPNQQLQLTTLQCSLVTPAGPTVTLTPTSLPGSTLTATPSPPSVTSSPTDTTYPASPTPITTASACNYNNGIPTDPTCPCQDFLVSCHNFQCVSESIRGLVIPDCQNNTDYCSKYTTTGEGLYCEAKPVIYLYPTQTTSINVDIGTVGQIVVSDPYYPIGGWKNVLAKSDGMLYYGSQKYSELFYETSVDKINAPKDGIIIKSADLDTELDKFITRLGLIGSEKREFLDWWLPRLKNLNSSYMLLSILDQAEKTRTDQVNIFPKPDTFIGFMAYFKPLGGPMSIKPLILPDQPPKRVGFTAVEWGGVLETKSR